jgi:hypothetical protein
MAMGSEVMMVELHDPNKLLKLPKLMKRILNRRVNAVNAVYRKVALEFEIVIIKTRNIGDVHNLRNWHIDRMHPGPAGHFMLARTMAEQLRKRGWAISLPHTLSINQQSRADKIKWMLRNGTPWFLKRSVDLLPAALILMTYELINLIIEKFTASTSAKELSFSSKIEEDPETIRYLKSS